MGQLISTLVYFFMAIWLAYRQVIFMSWRFNKAIPILIGSLLAFLAVSLSNPKLCIQN